MRCGALPFGRDFSRQVCEGYWSAVQRAQEKSRDARLWIERGRCAHLCKVTGLAREFVIGAARGSREFRHVNGFDDLVFRERGGESTNEKMFDLNASSGPSAAQVDARSERGQRNRPVCGRIRMGKT